MSNYSIATEIRDNNKIFYHPIVNGKETSYLFENHDSAVIFAIAYANLGNINDARYAEEFITRMLKIPE